MGSAMHGFPQAQRQLLQNKLRQMPGMIAALCRREQCDLALLSGDLFDGTYSREDYRAVYEALEEMAVPVFVTPGNHDYIAPASPWVREIWPENVHIFTKPQVESVGISALDCRVYGAGFTEKDCPALLEGLRAEQEQTYAIGVFHGDPTQSDSPYNPITNQQVKVSGLHYLALGHIHKADAFYAGGTLCAWPGCPMGTGYDEQGSKGVYIVEVGQEVTCRFVTLDAPRFFDLSVAPGDDPEQALSCVLPGSGSEDFYRVTFTGESDSLDLDALYSVFGGFPNLLLRDKTRAVVDLWADAGQDSFAGMYFGMLKQALENAPEAEKEKVLLTARLSRTILNGEEVALP